MKKHFISLLDNAHRKRTISFFAIAILLIIASRITGITDNLPGIAMLLSGIIFLFFTVLHPWRNPVNYVILLVVCVVIICLEWLGIHILDRLNKTEYISEAAAMIVAFCICLPGILVGIIGALICAFRKN